MHNKTLVVISCLFALSGCGGLVSSSSDEDSTSQGLIGDLGKHFRRFEVSHVAPVAFEARTAATMHIAGEDLVLELERRDLRSAKIIATRTTASGDLPLGDEPPRTYKGTVRGVPGSEVRISLDADGLPVGYYVTDGHTHHVDRAARYSTHAQPGQLVVYEPGDALDVGSPTCAGGSVTVGGAPPAPTLGDSQAAGGPLRVLELAIDADATVTAGLGAQTRFEMEQTLNGVEPIYEHELGLTFSIVAEHVWETPDPYSGMTREELLGSFKAHAAQAFGGAHRDVAYLFSRRDPAVYHLTPEGLLRLQGVADYKATCQAGAFAVSALYYGDVPAQVQLTAHEIGHTIGAQHPDVRFDGGPPVTACAGTIMQSLNATTSTFCEFSRNEIAAYLATVDPSHTCLPVGCTPTTCAQAGADCGTISDGCGATLSCGSCGGGQTCGGSGTPNVCSSSAPAPFDVEYWGMAGDVPFAGNFYADARADLAIFRPGDPEWYVRQRGNYDASQPQYFGWGYASDETVILHFAGGYDRIAQWRDSDGYWYTYEVGVGPVQYRQFGASGDRPVSGNLRGLGTDLAVYRPSTGVVYAIDYAGTSFTYHDVGSIPAERLFGGDFLGAGHDQIAFYAGGSWTIVSLETGERRTVQWGQPGDLPFVGRLLSATRTTLGVFRPGNGIVYLLDVGGSSAGIAFGTAGDVPLAGDYRGRGKDDLVQWRPSTGQWFIYNGL